MRNLSLLDSECPGFRPLRLFQLARQGAVLLCGSALIAGVLVGCNDGSSGGDTGPKGVTPPEVPPPIDVRFQQRMNAFTSDLILGNGLLFSMLLGDMDLDGDLDLFLNRHHLQRMEAFRNVGGEFEQFNRRGDDRSGLYGNRGVPDLYSFASEIEPEIDARGVPGIYVWHDNSIRHFWNVRFVPAAGESYRPMRIAANRPLTEIEGMAPGEFERVNDYTIDVALTGGGASRTIRVNNLGTSTQLKIDLEPGPFLPSFFVGTEFAEVTEGRLSLWKQDPHGMAFVDCCGSSFPDLYISLGGLAGTLAPPHDPKSDQLFEYKDGATLFEEVPVGAVPSGHQRGRQVAWVDVDGDGVHELYVANKQTRNVLLVPDGTGGFDDEAASRGLDLVGPESFAWLDVNLDGQLDLVYTDDASVGVALHRPGSFDVRDGADFGFEYSEPPGPSTGGIFDDVSLQVVDIDRDGDLDVFISRFDDDNRVAVFRRMPEGFVDATAEVGLDEVRDLDELLIGDIDSDGWIDLVTGSGAEITWWRNTGPDGFVGASISAEVPVPTASKFTLGDIDGDRWLDAVVITPINRQVLLNRSTGGNTVLEVGVDLPLGTLVRGYYADGSATAWQWGAATVSRYSQSLQPLRFGAGPSQSVVQIGVQLPGSAEERYRVDVPAGATRIDI